MFAERYEIMNINAHNAGIEDGKPDVVEIRPFLHGCVFLSSREKNCLSAHLSADENRSFVTRMKTWTVYPHRGQTAWRKGSINHPANQFHSPIDLVADFSSFKAATKKKANAFDLLRRNTASDLVTNAIVKNMISANRLSASVINSQHRQRERHVRKTRTINYDPS